MDGRDVKVEGYPDGNWMGPTILTDVTTDMDCYQQEIFGPVLVCLKADTIDEVRVEASWSSPTPMLVHLYIGNCFGQQQPLG